VPNRVHTGSTQPGYARNPAQGVGKLQKSQLQC